MSDGAGIARIHPVKEVSAMQLIQEVTQGRTDSELESASMPCALRRGVGKHLIAECWDCNDRIYSPTAVREALEDAVQASGATLLRLIVHTFEPYGVSAVAIVSESHLFIHTWPEMRYIAVDVFTCGETFPERALEVIREHFEPRRVKTLELERGVWP
ncbi:MAG: adenosylmethionine decarboxylase [Armatimonadota bacterium]